MFMRITYALMLGALLSILLPSAAQAADPVVEVDQTECVAPCTVTATETAANGTDYSWDFLPGRHQDPNAHYTMATGNPAQYTYNKPGEYYIQVRLLVDGKTRYMESDTITVLDPGDQPGDIALVSPCTGETCETALGQTFEFTSPKANLAVPDCYGDGGSCDPEVTRRTGPDQQGLYHHFVDLAVAPIGSVELMVDAWSKDRSNADREWFTVEVTENEIDPFGGLEADPQTAARRGKNCLVGHELSFYMTDDYTTSLRLLVQRKARGKWRTVKERSNRLKEDGSYLKQSWWQRVRVPRRELNRGKWRTVSAQMVVAESGVSYYREQSGARLSRGCR